MACAVPDKCRRGHPVPSVGDQLHCDPLRQQLWIRVRRSRGQFQPRRKRMERGMLPDVTASLCEAGLQALIRKSRKESFHSANSESDISLLLFLPLKGPLTRGQGRTTRTHCLGELLSLMPAEEGDAPRGAAFLSCRVNPWSRGLFFPSGTSTALWPGLALKVVLKLFTRLQERHDTRT